MATVQPLSIGEWEPISKKIAYIYVHITKVQIESINHSPLWRTEYKLLGAEFVVPFSSSSCSLALKSAWKSQEMTPFFVQKEVLGEKIIILVKYGNVFTQMVMFILK